MDRLNLIILQIIPLLWCFTVVVAVQTISRDRSYIEPVDDIELYIPTPQAGVKQKDVKCKKASVDKVYEEMDLDYYRDNYIRYFDYVNTENFRDMKDKLLDKPKTEVCYNVDIVDSNGTTMGAFECPLDFEHRDLTSCCGQDCAQFCCSPHYYSNSEQNWGAAAFTLILIFAMGLGLLFYCYLGSRI